MRNGYATPDGSSKIVRRRATKSGGERPPLTRQHRPIESPGMSAEPTFQDEPPVNAVQRARAKKSAGVSLAFPPTKEQPPMRQEAATRRAQTNAAASSSNRSDEASTKRSPKRAKKSVAVAGDQYTQGQLSYVGAPKSADTRAKKTIAPEELNRRATHISLGKPKVKLRAKKTIAAEESNKKRKNRSGRKAPPPAKQTSAAARQTKRLKKEKDSKMKAKASARRKTSVALEDSCTTDFELPEMDESWESEDSSEIDMAEISTIPPKISAVVVKICTETLKQQSDKQAALLQNMLGRNRRTAISSRMQRAAPGEVTRTDREHQNNSLDLTLAPEEDENDSTIVKFGARGSRDPPHSLWVPIRRSFWTADAADDDDGQNDETERDTLRKRMEKYGPVASQEQANARIDLALRRLHSQLGDISGFLNFVADRLGEPANIVHQRHRKMIQPQDPPVQWSSFPYRDLWCPQCTLYFCNRHGILEKSEAGVELIRIKLGLENERAGKWGIDAPTLPDADESTLTASLSEGQKMMFAQAFQTFGGDLTKLARFLRVPAAVATEYAKANNMLVVPEALLQPIDFQVDPKKESPNYYNVEQYTGTRHSDYDATKVLPESSPCYHEAMCNESNCTCIQNGHFCTRACVWGRPENSNFFRGCNCKGRCFEESSCPCYTTGRECDPSLCACDCCSDPVGQILPHGQARNDHVFMERAPVLGIRKSTVKKAGWGCFSLTELRSGEYVGEYVGELISRNEAERRGAIDDEEKRNFLINLVSDSIVDSSKYGNKTRFINDSTSPNVEPRGTFAIRHACSTLA